LLVMDRNHDGSIDNGGELFGDNSSEANGAKASDGFAALAALDSNHDGVIDARDAQFGQLQVWIDANGDGISQPGELETLAQAGVASISLASSKASTLDANGNWISATSSYTSTSGQQREVADVWFLSQSLAAAKATGAATAAAANPAPAGDSASATLGKRVSALTQAMAGYDGASPAGAGRFNLDAAERAMNAATTAMPAAGLAGNVTALARQLQQFGAGGGSGDGLADTNSQAELARRLAFTGMLASK